MLRFRCCLVALTRRFADIRRVYSCMGVASPRSLCHLIVRTCVCCKIVCNSCLRVYPLRLHIVLVVRTFCFFPFRGGKFFEQFLKRVILSGLFATPSEISSLLNAFCFYRGSIKRNVENFLIIWKLLKNFEMEKKAPKNVLSYYPVARILLFQYY